MTTPKYLEKSNFRRTAFYAYATEPGNKNKK